jgi:hypothetical protein
MRCALTIQLFSSVDPLLSHHEDARSDRSSFAVADDADILVLGSPFSVRAIQLPERLRISSTNYLASVDLTFTPRWMHQPLAGCETAGRLRNRWEDSNSPKVRCNGLVALTLSCGSGADQSSDLRLPPQHSRADFPGIRFVLPTQSCSFGPAALRHFAPIRPKFAVYPPPAADPLTRVSYASFYAPNSKQVSFVFF